MNKNSFIFLDIDGTIYDYHLGVPESTKEAIEALHENGHKVCLSTGRTKVLIFDEIMELGFDGIISGCGTFVEWEGKELFRKDLPKNEIKKLTGLFREYKFPCFGEGIYDLYFDPELVDDGAYAAYMIYQRKIPGHILPIDIENMSCAKMSALYLGKEIPKDLIDAIEDDYIWAAHNDGFFETVPKGCSKAGGFNILKDHLDIDPDKCYAFGDSFNDIDILKAVKYGVVMGNGDEDLKKRIPLHTESLEDGGVYKALCRFGLI